MTKNVSTSRSRRTAVIEFPLIRTVESTLSGPHTMIFTKQLSKSTWEEGIIQNRTGRISGKQIQSSVQVVTESVLCAGAGVSCVVGLSK